MTQGLIPEGRWRARAMNAELGYTQAGSEQAVVNFSLSGEQDADVDHRMVTWWGSFKDKAKPHTIKALLTCGWDGEDFAEFTGIDTNEVELVIIHEPDLKGQDRHRVRFVNAIGAGGAAVRNPLTDDQKRAFAAKMRGEVMAMKQGAAVPQPTAAPASKPAPARAPAGPKNPANAAAAPESDDILF